MPFADATSGAVVAGGDRLPVRQAGGKLRVATAVFNYASDAVGTYTSPIVLPAGAIVIAVLLNASASFGGTATLAIGTAAAAGKYRAAATYTSADTATWLGLNATLSAPLTEPEQILFTIAAAAAPSTGRMVISFLYADNS